MRFFFIAIILLINNYSIAKSSDNFYFRQIPLFDDMLSYINNIHISQKNGIIWIGTPEGLIRFDGKGKKIYTHSDNNPNSIPDGNILNIVEDKNNIWILTSRGIAIYSYDYDNFKIPLINGKPIIAYSAYIVNDGILFGGVNKIYKYFYNSNTFKEIATIDKPKNLGLNSIILLSEEKLLCTSRWHGLFIINIKNGNIIKSEFDKCSSHPMSIIMDNKRRIWLSDFNHGLKCLNDKGEVIKHYTTKNSNLSNNIILDLKEINNNIWIGTDGGGINILDPENNEFKVMKHISGDTHSLPVNTITCISGNNPNNVWAGSTRGGLIYIKKVNMINYSETILGYNKALSEKAVLTLSYNKDKNILWIGTDGGGINSFNLENKIFKHYPTTWGDQISSICDISEKQMLISIFSRGIYYFDKTNGNKIQLNIEDEELNKTLFYSGKSVLLHKYNDNILLLSDFIYKYNLKNHKIDTVKYENGIRNNESFYFISEDNDAIYFNDQHSVYKFTKNNDILYKLISVPLKTQLYSIARDKNKKFWIGTSDGLKFWNEKDSIIHPVKTSLFKRVNSVICDSCGNIWIGAEQKLFVYKPQENKFIMFDESDGVLPNEFSRTARVLLQDNNLFMGGKNGLLYVDTDIYNMFKYNIVPPVLITDFSINGENQKFKIKDNQITIPWNSKNIKINTIVKDEDILRNKLYSYNINGTIKNTFVPEIFIHSLKPGTYPIKLSYDLKDGNKVKDILLLTITVLPPWYATWWFMLLCVISVISLITGMFIYFVRKKENKLKWIMKEHEQKIYEDKVRFLINISHELRTPLTLIHAPLNRILKNIDKNSSMYEALFKIYRQANRMKEIINMVLDIRRMETGFNTISLKKQNFNEWLENVGEEFKDECSLKNVTLIINKDYDINEFAFDKNKCTIILTNLLSNALKHSPENSTITVSSQINREKNTIRITVTDEGKGIKSDEIEKLFVRFYQGENETGGSGIGLSYAKTLVEQHGGIIGAYPNKEKGASFFFEIPINMSNDETLTCQPKEYINELFGNENSNDIMSKSNQAENYNIENIKLLFIDDNKSLTDFMAEEMKYYYKDIVTSNSGKNILNEIEKIKPDIIVSDVMMPDMNGFEFCKAIKENINISHIPVILLTAITDGQSKEYGYKVGADAYMSKPFQTEELKNVIDNIIFNRKKAKEHYQNFGFLPEPTKETFSMADENFMKKLNKIIYDNIDNTNLDINLICNEIGMSRTSLYTKLKVITEMGANEYINKVRLEKAITLILSDKYTVNDIATMVGFNTSRYFSTAFKQYTGMTPTQYKNSNKNQDIEKNKCME